MLGARRRSRAARRRVRLLRTLGGVTALGLFLVWLTTSGGGIAAPAKAQVKLTVTLPRVAIAGSVVAGGANGGATGGANGVATGVGRRSGAAASAAPALAWPKTGQAAVAVPAVGFRAQSGEERPVPVASMTKIMTAYVVLEDHPLALGQQGPHVKITAADAAQFGTDTVTDQANVMLKRGEIVTEYQMLEGLLVHSANDLAYALATWDAGSVPAFVSKMNAAASALGMHHTHFADASGFSPSSMSTASDLLRVAAADMADPVFAQIVAMPEVGLPLAGNVESYTPLLGTTGVVGIKSGFTNAAGGGDLLAFRTSVGGHSVLALAAVTSQEGWTVLGKSGKEALGLARSAAARLQAVTLAPEGTVVARLTEGHRTVDVRTAAVANVLSLTDETVHQTVHVVTPQSGAKRGTQVGTATFVLAGQRVSVPVRLAARLP